MIKRSPIFGLIFWLMLFAVMLAEPAQAETLINSASRVRRDEQLLTLSQKEKFSTSAATLLAQESNSVELVKVTGVKLNSTQQELEVILETTGSDQLQPVTRSEGNNFIADIPNAQLVLPSGDEFRQENPASGITELSVTNIDANTIQVTVTGAASQPKVELFDSDRGLIFGVAITASSAQNPTPPTAPLPLPRGGEGEGSEQPAAEGDEPIELVVTGEQDGYYVPDASVGTKTDTPLRDIPQSVQVVPQQVLEDQQVTNLGEALRNVAGVSQGNNSSTRGFAALPVIRGFRAEDNITRDGLRDPGNFKFAFNSATVEQIEVLKGPASVLYGQGSLGGVVNIITKKTLTEPYYSVEASAGSYNFYRGAIDFSGPLNETKTVLYRLNVAALTTESFIDFYDEQQYIVAPALTWLGDRTKFTLAAEYIERYKGDGQTGLPVVGTLLPNPNGQIPRNRYLSDPSAEDNIKVFRVGYDLKHQFSEDWALRNVFNYSQTRADRQRPYTIGLGADNRTMNRGYVDNPIDDDVVNFDTYIVGKFQTGSIKHRLVAGFNYFWWNNYDYGGEGLAQPIDVFNPVYSQPYQASPIDFIYDYVSQSESFGFYIQDQLTLAENLKLLLGGRFDIANQKGGTISGGIEAVRQEAFSPRVGIDMVTSLLG
ncbi:TonB-dependent siderophore receptor [Chlorogloeopsis sp. ULAP01]|uniref:TonB-dependent siderophore receptor n=1 Tax=Chlorogloeopsis sp. ULAP01 TaxID=3056483 RepID=UPI0025AA9ED9|nr:TonB-dependent siderophore receptor [Chlorogloeopsis sp. ULAP01]MDM9383947.1 TonB-dependent siderophore receptor [Chlorogloeopsis sp. ULAP01]